jgi:hypothetical protein
MSRLALLACVFVIACDGGGTDVQTTGVVQETNVPCTPTDCICEREFVYYDQATRSCDGMLARISVCSDVEVCQAALDALHADVMACADPASPFAVDTSACDGP